MPSSELAKNSSKICDSELMLAIAAGDRRALEELYLSYHRRLARFLLRITQRYENVEEVINDTFFVVWQKAGEFRSASRVSTWIFGIAYRTALNSVRRQKNHTAALNLDDFPEQAIDPSLDTEMQDWLTRGLNQLPLEQRLTLELAYHMGHSSEEIALITGAPVGTVKTRMYHARQKLREYLPALGGTAVALLALALGLTTADRWRLGHAPTHADYYTVTTDVAHPPGEAIRAVFAPTITMLELQSALARSELRIVGGPTEAGVYSLASTSSLPVDSSLAILRLQPAVRFAEMTQPARGAGVFH